jgi:hypothetical protein
MRYTVFRIQSTSSPASIGTNPIVPKTTHINRTAAARGSSANRKRSRYETAIGTLPASTARLATFMGRGDRRQNREGQVHARYHYQSEMAMQNADRRL